MGEDGGDEGQGERREGSIGVDVGKVGFHLDLVVLILARVKDGGGRSKIGVNGGGAVRGCRARLVEGGSAGEEASDGKRIGTT